MKKEQGITLVTLVVTIIILIILAGVSITTLLGDNGLITKAQQARENIIYAGQEEQEQLNQLFWEMDQEGIYTEDEEDAKKDQMIELLQKQVEELKKQVADLQEENMKLKEQVAELNKQIEELNKQINDLKAQIAQKDIEIADLKKEVATKQETINNLQSQLDSLNSLLSQTNATQGKILEGYKAYSGGQLLTGTMMNRGNMNQTLNCGQSFTIPAGYHNGSGKVTANSLASQTQGTATANNLSSGVTAWVNGQKITGNGTDVNNAYNNGYNAGYSAGKTALSSKTINFSSNTYAKSNSGTINVSGYRYLLVNSIQIGNIYASSHSSGTYIFGDISGTFLRGPSSMDNPARMPNWFALNGKNTISWSYTSTDNEIMTVNYTLVE